MAEPKFKYVNPGLKPWSQSRRSVVDVPNTIYWIRHAESCANLLENKIVDRYADSTLSRQHSIKFATHAGEHRYFNDDGDIIDEKETKSYPDYIGTILDSIRLKIPAIEFKKTIINEEGKKEVGIFKGPESRWLFHPPLSSVGEKQAVALKTQPNFTKSVSDCNVFITSATVRTIMTAIYSLNGIKDVILYVVPYINEKMNESSEYGVDFVNTSIPRDKIDEIIEYVIRYIIQRGELQISPTSEPVGIHQFKIGSIIIDTSFYHTFDLPTTPTSDQGDVEEANKRILESNIATFKRKIIPELANVVKMPVPKMTILAFSHGYVITKLLRDYKSDYPDRVKYAPNVSMFKEDYQDSTMKVVPMHDKVGNEVPDGGVFVRGAIENEANAITGDDNYDSPLSQVPLSPCSLFGLRGDISKILLREYITQAPLKSGGSSTRKYKKYKTRTLLKHRKQTKRPRDVRIRRTRRTKNTYIKHKRSINRFNKQT